MLHNAGGRQRPPRRTMARRGPPSVGARGLLRCEGHTSRGRQRRGCRRHRLGTARAAGKPLRLARNVGRAIAARVTATTVMHLHARPRSCPPAGCPLFLDPRRCRCRSGRRPPRHAALQHRCLECSGHRAAPVTQYPYWPDSMGQYRRRSMFPGRSDSICRCTMPQPTPRTAATVSK